MSVDTLLRWGRGIVYQKTCNKCRRRKDQWHFRKKATSGDGYDQWCKQCRSAYEQAWRRGN